MESIISQRPVVPVSDDINGFKALTPDHFISVSDCYNFSSGAGNGARCRPKQTYSGTGEISKSLCLFKLSNKGNGILSFSFVLLSLMLPLTQSMRSS